MTTFLRHRLWPAIALLIAMTIVTGFLYPLAVTAVAQVAFPHQANGSFIVTADGRTIGSSLIGQAFERPKYFSGRPSAAGDRTATTLRSAGSNLGPTNQKLIDRIAAAGRCASGGQRRQADPGRPRDDVGVGTRSRHQPRRGGVPGRPRRQERAMSEAAVRAVVAPPHGAAVARVPRRATRQRVAPQSRPRRPAGTLTRVHGAPT